MSTPEAEESTKSSGDDKGSKNLHYQRLVRTLVRGPWRTHGRQGFTEADVLQRLGDLGIDPGDINDANFADTFRQVTEYYGAGSTHGSGVKDGAPRRGRRMTGRRTGRKRY